MATKTEILNMALANIGSDLIGNIDEDNPTCANFRLLYDAALTELLRSYPWGFAYRNITPARFEECPDGFAAAYMYPADCVFVRRVYSAINTAGDREEVLWERGRSIDGKSKAILLWDSSPISMEYTTNAIPESDYDPSFIRALSWCLSSTLCLGVRADIQSAQNAQQAYQLARQIAITADAHESRIHPFTDGAFNRARRW